MRQLPCAAIVALTAACNTVLGVDDVAQLPPDAAMRPPPDAPPDAPPDCKVSADYPLIKGSSPAAVLRRRSDGGPTVTIQLNNDTKPDLLGILLFNNMGGHDILNVVGIYSLAAADAQLASCGICVLLLADIDRASLVPDASYLAFGQGTLTVTRSDATGLAARLQNLRLRHVDISTSATREINDGCTTAIEDVEFDLPYSP